MIRDDTKRGEGGKEGKNRRVRQEVRGEREEMSNS